MNCKSLIVVLVQIFLFCTTAISANYYTQYFSGNFDLNGVSLTFTPDGSENFYSESGVGITNLPVDTTDATGLLWAGTDDGSIAVNINTSVSLYGTTYDTVYIGSNGYLTFESIDTTWTASVSNHFSQARISLFYTDLDTRDSGQVKSEELDDRFVITYLDVPHFSNDTNQLCTAQCEIFFDGTIRMSWINVSANYGSSVIVGLSDGNGTPSNFSYSDLSSVVVDFDADNIPDSWESQYFSSTASCVATNDPDSDGYNNLDEYIAGTIPTNSASFFQISVTNSVTQPSSEVVINWNAVEGRTYSITWNDKLGSAFTSLETGITFPQNSYTSTAVSAENQGFFKVNVQMAQ